MSRCKSHQSAEEEAHRCPVSLRKTFPRNCWNFYDYYAHGLINRREFLDRAALFTLGGLTASALLASLSPDYALAEQVEFTDPDIIAEYVTYPSPKGNGQVRAYHVRPAKAAGKVAAVVVVHENRGLNPYIEDVARRLAKAGFIALAPDGLSSVGGYPGNDDKGRALQEKVDPQKLMNDFFAAVEWMMKHPDSSGKVGITGFCYGGGVTNAAAARQTTNDGAAERLTIRCKLHLICPRARHRWWEMVALPVRR